MPQLSAEKRAKVIALLEEGFSARYIAHVEKIHYATVYRIKKRIELTGGYENKSRPGRPRLLTGRDERKALRLIISNEVSTAIRVREQLKIEENIKVSTETVRRTLR